ncbi:MAG: hypothetical protein NT066_06345 [Candidatus Omnitrophica bacterium]|nr:hypothetical protein [Candidatus Omnitrophota bacterium]
MPAILEITRSRLRQKLLSHFFTNPEASLYLREIASLLREDPGNLSKELAQLARSGTFLSKVRGNQKYFSLNKDYPLYKELKSIIFKTVGVEGSLKEIIANARGINFSFIYGSFANRREQSSSEIDLLIVGSPDENKLMEKIESLEKNLCRQINYNIYSPKEFKEKLKKKDTFILNILKRPKIVLKGNLNAI